VRNLRDRLGDILDAIGQIETEAVKGKSAFEGNALIQVWMVHHLKTQPPERTQTRVEAEAVEQAVRFQR